MGLLVAADCVMVEKVLIFGSKVGCLGCSVAGGGNSEVAAIEVHVAQKPISLGEGGTA